MGDRSREMSTVGDFPDKRRHSNSSNDSRSDHDDADHGIPFREELLPRPAFGHNRYATRKTAAQGMMDVALLLANASQLKSVVEAGPTHSNYVFLFVMIVISICLQIATGLLLLVVGSRESKSRDEDDVSEHTNKLNNVTVAMVFIITVVNIFITSFGLGDGKSPERQASNGL